MLEARDDAVVVGLDRGRSESVVVVRQPWLCAAVGHRVGVVSRSIVTEVGPEQEEDAAMSAMPSSRWKIHSGMTNESNAPPPTNASGARKTNTC